MLLRGGGTKEWTQAGNVGNNVCVCAHIHIHVTIVYYQHNKKQKPLHQCPLIS